MDITKLSRQSHRHDRPGLRLLNQFDLPGGRAHEFCGHGRRRLALWLAAADRQTDTASQILWIRPEWHPDRLHMAGVRHEIDPGRLMFVECCRPSDLLWCMEEALRSGLTRLVVLDLPEPPELTPVRRLHLAAEAGFEKTGRAPLGVILTPGDGGAPGVESRWQLSPAHGAETDSWRLSRLRARTAPVAEWAVTRTGRGRPVVQMPAPEPGFEPA
jgi:protein ImuA